MDDPRPSTSKDDDSEYEDAEGQLESAKATFEKSIWKSQVNAEINVRRRTRGCNFIAEDILYEVNFSRSDEGNLKLITALISIYHVIIELVRSLKRFYSNKKRRLCFFSCTVPEMVSGIYTGGQNLYTQSERSISHSILSPLFHYLTSNAEIRLSSDLCIKVSVLSLEHTRFYDRNKKTDLWPVESLCPTAIT